MDDSSETSRVTFVNLRIGDGPSRRVRSIETRQDGSKIVTDYEELSSADDPHVRSRRRTRGDDPPDELVTEFLPSAVRPPTYPGGFPFLEGRESCTTESPARSGSPRASWRCHDPDTVLAALIETSLTDGWTRVAQSTVPPFMRANAGTTFSRGNDVRLFTRVDHEQGSVIRLTEFRGDWLDLPNSNESPANS